MRGRYFVAVSVAYIALGIVILTRAVVAHVYVIGVLGLVFILLGAIRLRDYRVHRERAS